MTPTTFALQLGNEGGREEKAIQRKKEREAVESYGGPRGRGREGRGRGAGGRECVCVCVCVCVRAYWLSDFFRASVSLSRS